MTQGSFRRKILTWFKAHGRRNLPWRRTTDPYKIFVSELMLQQTQVSRVVPKYKEFIKRFPTTRALAKAPLADVLKTWQGLGYNRRALFAKRAAEKLVKENRAAWPKKVGELEKLPGIGPYTARAIVAFTYNQPQVLIETNIRRVFIHFFFPGKRNVSDAQIAKLVTHTLDRKNPRRWYWALMDYGALALTGVPNPNRRSRHYAKQSKFIGSDRQLRGQVLKLLLANPSSSAQKLAQQLDVPQERLAAVVAQLAREGLVNLSQEKKKEYK